MRLSIQLRSRRGGSCFVRGAARSLLSATLACAPLASFAATDGATDTATIYSLGVAGGYANGRVDCVDTYPCDHHSGYGKVTASAWIASTVELQASYFRVGHLQGGDTTPLGTRFGGTFKLSGAGLTAGYRWNLAPDWSVTARGGLAAVRARFDYAPPFAGEPSKTTVQPLGGLNLDYALTPALRVGLDYQATRLKAHVTRGTLQMIGVGVQLSF